MTSPVMTFHESYGDIPRALLALIKKRNVSPADYYTMEYMLGEGEFQSFYNHIESHLNLWGKYFQPFPFEA
jgi:hypothetical protein